MSYEKSVEFLNVAKYPLDSYGSYFEFFYHVLTYYLVFLVCSQSFVRMFHSEMLSSTPLFKQHQCKWHEFVMPPPNFYHASCYLRTLSAFSSSSLNTLSRWLSLSYSYWSSFSSSRLFCWSSGTANNAVSLFTFSIISNCRLVYGVRLWCRVFKFESQSVS